MEAREMLDGTWVESPWPAAMWLALLGAAALAARLPRARPYALLAISGGVYVFYGPATLAANAFLVVVGAVGVAPAAAGKPGRSVVIALLLPMPGPVM